jgi:hypothetical protein
VNSISSWLRKASSFEQAPENVSDVPILISFGVVIRIGSLRVSAVLPSDSP